MVFSDEGHIDDVLILVSHNRDSDNGRIRQNAVAHDVTKEIFASKIRGGCVGDGVVGVAAGCAVGGLGNSQHHLKVTIYVPIVGEHIYGYGRIGWRAGAVINSLGRIVNGRYRQRNRRHIGMIRAIASLIGKAVWPIKVEGRGVDEGAIGV